MDLRIFQPQVEDVRSDQKTLVSVFKHKLVASIISQLLKDDEEFDQLTLVLVTMLQLLVSYEPYEGVDKELHQ